MPPSCHQGGPLDDGLAPEEARPEKQSGRREEDRLREEAQTVGQNRTSDWMGDKKPSKVSAWSQWLVTERGRGIASPVGSLVRQQG